jgi:DNA-binding beta-propeller fold protein YncE
MFSASEGTVPWRAFAVGLIALAASLLLAAPALAVEKYHQVGQFTNNFSFLLADSVAVNDHNGHIYVADSGSGHVYNFSSPSDTSPVSWDGSSTPAGSFGGYVSVAADNSTGDVYVADRGHAVIDKFDQEGNLITSFGDSSPSHNGQLAGTATPAGSFSPAGSGYSSFGIAVDQATHDLYAIDAHHEVIDVFSEAGAYIRQITAKPSGLYRFGGEYATGLAVSSAGNVYAADWAGPNLVFQFDSAGSYVRTFDGSNTPDGNFSGECTGCSVISVGVDDTSGRVFVGAMAYSVFDVFDSSGNFLPPQATGIQYPSSMAVDQSNGHVYVSTYSFVYIWAPFIAPDISVSAATNLQAHSATLHGHVDPAGGGPVTACKFEYEGGTAGLHSVPCATSPPSSLPYTNPTDVSATATGLEPGTDYTYRLVVENANGSNETSSTFESASIYQLAGNYGSSGTGDGQFDNPQAVAVDNSSGALYVADTGNHRVVKLDSSGNFVSAWGWGVSDGSSVAEVCTSGCQAGKPGSGAGQFTAPTFIAVDNTNGPSAGDVYVGDTADNVVQKFDPTGHLVTSFGSGGAQTYGEGIEGVAVGPAGNLIVPPGSPAGIAVDSLGRVFGGMLAIDTSNNDLYYDSGTEIQRYATEAGCDPSDPYIPCPPEAFGVGHLHSAAGASIDPGTKVLYVANAGDDDIAVFERLPMPQVSTAEVTTLDLTSATLVGSVSPSGSGNVTNCEFEYGQNNQYGTSVPCEQAVPPSGSTEVTADLTGLQPFTTYHYRLSVTADGDFGLIAHTPDRTFTTNHHLTPSISGSSFSNLTSTTVTMNAQINPNLAPTIYRFQYGPQSSYGQQTLNSESIGEDNEVHSVSTQVTGLTPATTYHFRVLATNFNGNATGPDLTFTTPSLPVIDASAASGVTESSATLSATVRPGFRPTTYHFDYGRTGAYGSRTPESGSIGSDNSVYPVSAALAGLAPETTYHFRIVAVNAVGTTEGPDATFTTPPTNVSPKPSATTKTTCKKGFVVKHRKCVKKARHHKRQQRSQHHG